MTLHAFTAMHGREDTMNKHTHIYIAIDLKSFYASVECVDRQLDPLTTNLVVADVEKTSKTICLAVTPSLKKYGIAGRARLFQVIQKVQEVNQIRKKDAPCHTFCGESYDDQELQSNPALALSYIAAPPRMAHYMAYSTKIYEIYLHYVSAQDIHVYSIDEVFMDVTSYLKTYKVTPSELARNIMREIKKITGITATAGIGTNLYLCKVAMDILAKHVQADQDGVRIAQLDEQRYRRLLWSHRPLTDFWRVGKGYANKLETLGLYTMGDIARYVTCNNGQNEDTLYSLFGVNAELLIDHAWGYESCTMADIKAYKSTHKSMGSSQVLSHPYTYKMARLIVKEMVDGLALQLVEKMLECDQVVLVIGYDTENMSRASAFVLEVHVDHYGRKVPKHAQGRVNLKQHTSSCRLMKQAVLKLYDSIVNPHFTIRRVTISLQHVVAKQPHRKTEKAYQLDLFCDPKQMELQKKQEEEALEKEYKLQQTTLSIKKKYGKNALIKGMDLEDGAKSIERNNSIGGHKA